MSKAKPWYGLRVDTMIPPFGMLCYASNKRLVNVCSVVQMEYSIGMGRGAASYCPIYEKQLGGEGRKCRTRRVCGQLKYPRRPSYYGEFSERVSPRQTKLTTAVELWIRPVAKVSSARAFAPKARA